MKVVKIDSLGRIVIPISFREALGIKPDSELITTLQNGSVLITPKISICRICGNPVSNKKCPLCDACILNIKSLTI